MSKKQYIGIIILAVMILGFLFYWYEFRPSQIKKECYKIAKQRAKVKYLLSDKGIKEAQEKYSFKEEAKEKELPELPKSPRENLYLEYGFEDYYKNCLNEKGF